MKLSISEKKIHCLLKRNIFTFRIQSVNNWDFTSSLMSLCECGPWVSFPLLCNKTLIDRMWPLTSLWGTLNKMSFLLSLSTFQTEAGTFASWHATQHNFLKMYFSMTHESNASLLSLTNWIKLTQTNTVAESPCARWCPSLSCCTLPRGEGWKRGWNIEEVVARKRKGSERETEGEGD